MDQEELIEILKTHEWRDVEFKEAQQQVPKSAYETVSAFANTEGGHLVFGVRKENEDFEVVGVLDVDKVQNEFLSTLRQPDKISVVLDIKEGLYKHGEDHLLVFYVPEAHRSNKPVHLNRDIRRSFVRKGGCDIRCSDSERNRFLIDASAERYDGQALDLDPNTCFDTESIKWYRSNYEGRMGNRSYVEFPDQDFLAEMGLLVEQAKKRVPTRAAIILFGSNAAVRQILPRPIVDCQHFNLELVEVDTGARWIDRIIIEENLITAWQALVVWYQKLGTHPFKIDSVSLQRDDTPPDYRAFREGIVNLLIHQDYADHSRKGEIRHYKDQIVFWNPGDAFDSAADLLEPGEKEVRNPRIVSSFRRIGLSEHAGWGLRDVFRNWQQLGHFPPRIINDKSRKTFELILKKEELLSVQQLLFQTSLGVHLNEEQARAFAYVCQEKEVSLSELKAVTGLTGPDAIKLANSLVTQMLLKPIVVGGRYALAEHLQARFTNNIPTVQVPHSQPNLSTAQVDADKPNLSTEQVQPLKELSETHWKIIALCEVPRRLAAIMEAVRISNRGYFKTKHLNPLIRIGLVVMTNPDNPRASNQKYVITEAGAKLKAHRMAAKAENNEGNNGKI